jgi:hypothetical protein
MKEGDVKIVYKHWRKQKGDGELAVLIEFIDYARNFKEHIMNFYIEDIPYYGERWLVSIGGIEVERIIRISGHGPRYENENIGWEYTSLKEVPSDSAPNPITDGYEYFEKKYTTVFLPGYLPRLPNKELESYSKEQDKIDKALRKVIKNDAYHGDIRKAAHIRLQFRKSPSYTSLLKWRNVEKHIKDDLEACQLAEYDILYNQGKNRPAP